MSKELVAGGVTGDGGTTDCDDKELVTGGGGDDGTTDAAATYPCEEAAGVCSMLKEGTPAVQHNLHPPLYHHPW